MSKSTTVTTGEKSSLVTPRFLISLLLVVVGMLGCFLVGLIWICTFYVFSDDLSSLWVMNDLGQWNLVVGIAVMAVGFSFATKWE